MLFLCLHFVYRKAIAVLYKQDCKSSMWKLLVPWNRLMRFSSMMDKRYVKKWYTVFHCKVCFYNNTVLTSLTVEAFGKISFARKRQTNFTTITSFPWSVLLSNVLVSTNWHVRNRSVIVKKSLTIVVNGLSCLNFRFKPTGYVTQRKWIAWWRKHFD